MKYFLIAFFLIIILILFRVNQLQPTEGEMLVNSLLARSSTVIRDKYSLLPYGAGVAMPGGPIKELFLGFSTKEEKTKDELRVLLIEISNDLIKQVMDDEKIQQHLLNRPFTQNDLHIAIYNTDKAGIEIFDPGISIAKLQQGKITYLTVDQNNTYRYKNRFEEKYEEALKAIEKDVD